MNSNPQQQPVDPMTPRLFQVERWRRELSDTFTLELVAPDQQPFQFEPGQFNMLYMFGTGESPISISGDPGEPGRLIHTVRAVGKVTEGLQRCRAGDTVGVRGPYGTAWPVAQLEGHDVVIVTGGIGLAPLRPAIYHLLANRHRYGRIIILYGARSPGDILYRKALEKWRSRFDLTVEVTVDHATADWAGKVGVVPKLIAATEIDPIDTSALVCGPEIMMRYSVEALRDLGVADRNIHISMERNMKCALGYCGHCQLGGQFVCRDGPVFPYEKMRDAFRIREL